MSHSADLRHVLETWPYDPDNEGRVVRGDDGRQILQVRTPLGIEQYELDGRPDGIHPHGKESALHFHLDRLERARRSGNEAGFELTSQDCGELFDEGMLYYFRYIRLFQLHDWRRTLRDTSRNLRVFDLVQRYAQREEDRQFLERWRPYILRINASAAAMQQLERNAFDKGLEIINKAVEKIEGLEDLDDETFAFERDRSLSTLRLLASQIQKSRPVSEMEKLETQLQRAIETQEFERAAQLRDHIRDLKKHQPQTP
jgi:UvrB/uvrC motif